MDITVTGSAGFIGTRLVARLLASGHRVRCLDLRETPVPSDAATGADLRTRTGDVRREGDLRDAVTTGTDVVVHLAALAGVTPSLARPESYLDTNVGGTLRVLQACERAGVPRLVLASSSSVYGDCPVPAQEDRGYRPLSPYAASKVAAEALAESWARRGGVEVAAVRPFTVYGPGQRPDMAISRFLTRLDRGEPLQLWDFVRDFTYVDDVVDGLVGALTAPLRDGFRAYNLGSGKPVTAGQLVRTLAEATGRIAPDIPVTACRPGPGEAPRTWADPARARAELGFLGRTSLLDGLRAQADRRPAMAG